MDDEFIAAHRNMVSEIAAEAQRFLEKVATWRTDENSANNAAMKRSSLDLTHALVRIRAGSMEHVPKVKASAKWLTVGPILICIATRTVCKLDGSDINLTSTEFDILRVLVESNGATTSHSEMSEKILCRAYHPEDRAIDQLVHSLRDKMPWGNQDLIKSIRGKGYWIQAHE